MRRCTNHRQRLWTVEPHARAGVGGLALRLIYVIAASVFVAEMLLLIGWLRS